MSIRQKEYDNQSSTLSISYYFSVLYSKKRWNVSITRILPYKVDNIIKTSEQNVGVLLIKTVGFLERKNSFIKKYAVCTYYTRLSRTTISSLKLFIQIYTLKLGNNHFYACKKIWFLIFLINTLILEKKKLLLFFLHT